VRREEGGEAAAAALHYCCTIMFLEVSEFYQFPHGAIMPQYVDLTAVKHRKKGPTDAMYFSIILTEMKQI
jgi:hypothetical protein